MELEDLKDLNFKKLPTMNDDEIKKAKLLVNAFFYLNSKQSSVLEELVNLIYSIQLSNIEEKNKFLILFGDLLDGRKQFDESLCYFLEHITKRD